MESDSHAILDRQNLTQTKVSEVSDEIYPETYQQQQPTFIPDQTYQQQQPFIPQGNAPQFDDVHSYQEPYQGQSDFVNPPPSNPHMQPVRSNTPIPYINYQMQPPQQPQQPVVIIVGNPGTIGITPDVASTTGDKRPVWVTGWMTCSIVCLIVGALLLIGLGIMYIFLITNRQITSVLLYPLGNFLTGPSTGNSTRTDPPSGYLFGKNPIEDTMYIYSMCVFALQIAIGVLGLLMVVMGFVAILLRKRIISIIGSVSGFVVTLGGIGFCCVSCVPTVMFLVVGLPFIILCGCGPIFLFFACMNWLVLSAMQCPHIICAFNYGLAHYADSQPFKTVKKV